MDDVIIVFMLYIYLNFWPLELSPNPFNFQKMNKENIFSPISSLSGPGDITRVRP